MEDLLINPTKNTPLVDFFSSGKLAMTGSAFAENAKEFFDPIIIWIEELTSTKVDFDLNLNYINTASAKKLYELLQKLHLNKQIEEIRINWFYEQWDEDSLETGKILADSLPRAVFQYIEYEEETE